MLQPFHHSNENCLALICTVLDVNGVKLCGKLEYTEYVG